MDCFSQAWVFVSEMWLVRLHEYKVIFSRLNLKIFLKFLNFISDRDNFSFKKPLNTIAGNLVPTDLTHLTSLSLYFLPIDISISFYEYLNRQPRQHNRNNFNTDLGIGDKQWFRLNQLIKMITQIEKVWVWLLGYTCRVWNV